jgi:uncharacterized protein DUF4412
MFHTDRINRYASRSSMRLGALLAMLCAAATLAACGGALKSSPTTTSGGASSSGGSSASSSSGGGDNFEGVVVMKSQSGTEKMPIVQDETYYMKGTHLRIESSSNLSGLIHSKTAMIEDFDSGKIIALYPDRKQYMVMNLGEFAGAADTENSGNTLTRTGQKETIAGYTCEDYHLVITGENAETVDICVAKGLGNYMSGFAKFFNARTRAKLEANPAWKGFFEGGMFPLRQKIVSPDGTTQEHVVTSIERKKLDDALFTMPSGFTEMKEPGEPAN